MALVKDILFKKNSDVFTISTDKSVKDALHLLSEKNIGALVVLNFDKKVVGIFSERDYVRKVISTNDTLFDALITNLMTPKVLVVSPEATAMECMTIMTKMKVRHLPVIDNGDLKGVISIGDVVNKIISDQDFSIDQLIKYISGNY